ncbi:dihydroorotase [Deinobacterium chartae]|uniref:Dihydroorotase n=1 Tax=Deinobacterium chartae TaxID=521158 RepID=A0A841HY16_9DEIO|nr:dihydroorotase [Deinobacterium chartae]MBB6097773.1 dihydroorotase [Deinobacterium chartae]
MITELKNVRRMGENTTGSLFFENGTIRGWNLDLEAQQVLDGRGGTVLPAFLELHAHLREPGQEQKEDLESGLAAAAAGGYGTVVSMPNTAPVVDDPGIVRALIEKSERLGFARLRPSAALSRGQQGEALADLRALRDAGAVMFTDDGRTNEDAHLLRRGLEYAHSLGVLVSVHAEDATLRKDGVMNEGTVSEELGLPGNPWAAEAARVARDVEIALLTGARLHIQHLSTARALEVVRDAKRRGAPVTCEVCPHHLTLTDEALRSFDAIYKVAPPLRTQADADALLRGLLDGTVDCLATDHAPHTQAEKERDLLEAPFGIPNIEVAFALLYTRLVASGRMSLEALVDLFTAGPARVMGWAAPQLEAGAVADVVVVDLEGELEVRPESFKSKARFSPWAGERLRGWPLLTVVNGRVAFQR